jgi:hypothetical protein
MRERHASKARRSGHGCPKCAPHWPPNETVLLRVQAACQRWDPRMDRSQATAVQIHKGSKFGLAIGLSMRPRLAHSAAVTRIPGASSSSHPYRAPPIRRS